MIKNTKMDKNQENHAYHAKCRKIKKRVKLKPCFDKNDGKVAKKRKETISNFFLKKYLKC
jgi:hypothetical protein